MIVDILASGESPIIDTEKIASSAKDATSAGVVIQNYVALILQQSDLSLPDVLPELPGHQIAARNHAINWRDNIQPFMIRTNSDIIDFANAFDSYYDPLSQLATMLQKDPANNEAIATFKLGLNQLKDLVNTKKENTEMVIKILEQFDSDIAIDARSFASDFDTASNYLAGKSGEIAALKKQLETYQSSVNRDCWLIAGGSVAFVAGAVMVVVGFLAEIPTAGASTALVVTGIAVAAGGATTAIAGAVDLANNTKMIGETIVKLSDLGKQYAATSHINSTVQNFRDGAIAALNAVNSLLIGWQTLDKDFEEFIKELDRARPDMGFFLQAQLETAKKDWNDLADLARILQSYGSIPVNSGKVNELGRMDPFDAIKALVA